MSAAHRYFAPLSLLSISCVAMAAVEPTAPQTGDELRGWLDERGISAEVVYTIETVRKMTGGVAANDTMLLDNLTIAAGLDTAAAGWWQGGEGYVSILSNHGDDPSSMIGDVQVSSNIEADDSFRVFELWYDHTFFTTDTLAVSALIGLHDLNSEFYTSDHAALFLNSSFGIGPDLAGNVPTSIFNVSSLGLRLQIDYQESWSFAAAVYDGDPGDVDSNASGLDIDIDLDEQGLLSIAEVRYHHDHGLGGSLRLGLWYHSADFTSLEDGQEESGNQGFYLTADQMVSQEADGTQGLNAFLQLGMSPNAASDIEHYAGLGLSYTGLIPGRDADQIGVAINHATRNDDQADADSETVLEVIYTAALYERITATIDYQFIVNPGAAKPSVDDAHVIAGRLDITLF